MPLMARSVRTPCLTPSTISSSFQSPASKKVLVMRTKTF